MSSGEPIQIIAPVNHKFELKLENVKRILGADGIKDRNVVIVSVAGAFRKGKSFLLNFFLKYLNAQYKKHDVTDWLGEKKNKDELTGFEFRGGRKPKTTGIWMWSEIFTHNFENGEKVAILLLDTQGIFDNRSNLNDNTTIFAVSMMLSSVQCYNVMQNIQEDDFQHLELFTEFGRLALQQSNEKAFQKLLFIVRDWPNAFEMPYGDGQAFIDELLAETVEHSEDMKQLRRRIKSSFDKIGAYLMPSPGTAITTGIDIHGDLSRIDPEFIVQLKGLVPSIFAPENLIPKKVNGQKIRARDFVKYLETYVNIFNDGTLPEPQTILVATATTLLLVLCTDSNNAYIEAMEKSIEQTSRNENQPYFIPLDLKMAHDDAKGKCMIQFQQRQKIGGPQLIRTFETKLIKEIDEKFRVFAQGNREKESAFKAKALVSLRSLDIACVKIYVDKVQNSLNPINPISNHDLQQVHEDAKKDSITKFDNEQKFGSDEMIETFRSKLESEINLQFIKSTQQNEAARQAIEDLKGKSEAEKAKAIEKIEAEQLKEKIKRAEADTTNSQLIAACVNAYMVSVQKSLRQTDSFLSQTALEEIHENAKRDALSMFERDHDHNGRMTSSLLSRLKNDLDMNFIQFSHQNDAKRREINAAEEKSRMDQEMTELRAELENMKKPSSGGGSICSIL